MRKNFHRIIVDNLDTKTFKTIKLSEISKWIGSDKMATGFVTVRIQNIKRNISSTINKQRRKLLVTVLKITNVSIANTTLI